MHSGSPRTFDDETSAETPAALNKVSDFTVTDSRRFSRLREFFTKIQSWTHCSKGSRIKQGSGRVSKTLVLILWKSSLWP
jgi:hypothetical protein